MSRVRLDWAGLVLIMWSALTRASAGAEPLPGWDADPTRSAFAVIGIGPTGSLILDIAAWLGAALVFASRAGRSRQDPLVIVAFLGAIAILLRTFLIDSGNIEAIRIGSAWAAGWISFAAVVSQMHRPLVRCVVGSIAVSFVLYLCSKAFVQTFVEHTHMLANFDANREATLLAQGFEPESAQAMIYERRLRQPDPTGWFGLSNVLASFLAAGFVVLVYSALRASRATRWLLLLSALIALVVLALTGSKAGLAVVVLGLGLLIAAHVLPKKLVPVACIAAVAVPPAAVTFRGLVGVPANELSLLVRWFYMQGAVRVTGEELPMGVGPAGFQSAYQLAKPPEGTEDVTSPHLIWLDYSATLGLFAVPVLAALVWIVLRLGKSVAAKQPISHATSSQRGQFVRPVIVLTLIVPVLVGAWLEMQATPIENALARLVGVVAWGGASFMLVRAGGPPLIGLAAGAVVLLGHAELDMNMTLPGSVVLVMILLSLASGSLKPWLIQLPRPVLPAVACISAIWLAFGSVPVWKWESALRTSSSELRGIVLRQDELLAAGAQQWELVGLQDEFLVRADASLDSLESAYTMFPEDVRVARAAARLAMTVSGSALERLDRTSAVSIAERASSLLSQAIEHRPTSSLYAQRASVRYWLFELVRHGPVREERLAELKASASDDYEEAARLAPYNHRPATALAMMLSELGDADDASRWASEALERDSLGGLDPLSMMPDKVRQRLEEMVLRP
ncbi:MAG: hypothetical protein ED559_07300 [Phycisphaera sp.]|nr:MAG: hypothetical protein ED559_07300 [Phycisphaera sp.]